ncbi:MAG: FAD-binding oxidoreductase [Deltaproteobacteria bacterium]|nr:FAD-binding oxidoreductase [Deltaproteobacteria bacterium]
MSDNNALEDIVGTGNVLDGIDILREYSSDLSFVPSRRPRCVAKPSTADEVQGIVKWANETMTPLVPVSSGPPHFRGDTIPAMGGSVIIDLSRMKKIIRIDPINWVVMVEPGVTFGELQPELEKAGLSTYTPLCPRGSKSVALSMLEREPITIPAHHWDALDPFLCAEIIFGTGDKLRSGEAAGPDSIEDQWKIGKAQMVPFGLGQFDESRLISGAQGTIGIITWATVKCRPSSTRTRTFLISSETIEPLLDLSYRLIRVRLGETCFIVNDLKFASLLGKNQEEIRELRAALPRWILVVTLEGYGPLPEGKVEYQEADFRDMLKQAGNLRHLQNVLSFSEDDITKLLTKPSDEPYWKLRYKGGFSDIFFLNTLDNSPAFIGAMHTLAHSRRFPSEDIGVYIQPIVQGTSCHLEFDLFYDATDSTQTERAQSLVTEGAYDLANMGAFFSRPYGTWAKIAYSRAAETNILQRKVKKIFDPNNVLNPGRLCF